MGSRDTIPFRITIETAAEIERIREVIAKEMGIKKESITKKQGEIVLRIKSKRGKIFQPEIMDILLGKIK